MKNPRNSLVNSSLNACRKAAFSNAIAIRDQEELKLPGKIFAGVLAGPFGKKNNECSNTTKMNDKGTTKYLDLSSYILHEIRFLASTKLFTSQ
ncbi:MAG: hypothetical protein IT342_03825 [Candidatus Melainabacteria bacterium]|nr:hypothetical protein [Candidatus Melainabacteria bacterium]